MPASVTLDQSILPPVAGRTVWRQVDVPDIGTGAAYADKDQLGSLMEIGGIVRPEKRTGLLHTALYYDLDDEGLQVDFHLFRRKVTLAADNAAFSLADGDLLHWIGTLQFTAFFDFANGQGSQLANVGLALDLPTETLYIAAQARGALNIAAGNLPRLAIAVLPD